LDFGKKLVRNPPPSPKVIEYCQRCSKSEGVAIVAYCCYLSFTDGTIEAAEADTVNAIAEQFGISPAMTDLHRK
jgi:tellurite resistance protein